MVKERGQTMTEFILLLAILTLVGAWLMNVFVGGSSGTGGAIRNPNGLEKTGITKIATEKD